MYTIVYDPKRKQPGCVLLQAAYGATVPQERFRDFSSKSWLTVHTPDMGLFAVTETQLDKLIALANAACQQTK